MSDIKWFKLQLAVEALPFPPAYALRCVTDKEEDGSVVTDYLKDIPRYLGGWSGFYAEGMPEFFNIEWVKVRPQLAKYRGQLVQDEIIDETDLFREILEHLSIPHEEEHNVFTIYGYKA